MWRNSRALPVFINQALDGQPITIHGDGLQTRSFCFVSDLVEGLVRLSASDEKNPVNIGNPVEISVLDIAKEVIEIVGGGSEIVHIERPTDDPQLRCPDITRAKNLLGWSPRIERRDGFRVHSRCGGRRTVFHSGRVTRGNLSRRRYSPPRFEGSGRTD